MGGRDANNEPEDVKDTLARLKVNHAEIPCSAGTSTFAERAARWRKRFDKEATREQLSERGRLETEVENHLEKYGEIAPRPLLLWDKIEKGLSEATKIDFYYNIEEKAED